MQLLDSPNVKYSFTTRIIPFEEMTHYAPLTTPPQIGDVVVAEVLSIGKHSALEMRIGANIPIFPGDTIVGVFGNRYATDQFEGYVPSQPIIECDLLSVGGVCGKVASAHTSMSTPTRLRMLGNVCNQAGEPINQRAFGLPLSTSQPQGEVILVVGSSMNSGKTTTVGTLVRALNRDGFHVAAAKVTGTAAGKDGRYFMGCGARQVLDFTDAGYPSTYMLSIEELHSIYHSLLTNLRASKPDYIILEIADGIFQRETRMLLESGLLRSTVDHIFFAAGDSLAVECGIRHLNEQGWYPRAVSGAITQSPLMMGEAEAATGIRCLTIDQMMEGEASALLQTLPPFQFEQFNSALTQQVA